MNTATPTPPNAHTMQADYRLIKVGVLGFFPDLTTVTIGVAGVDVDRCADRNGDAEGEGQPSNDRRHTGEERHADDQRYADHDQCNEVYSTTHQAAFRSREGQSGEMHARTAESPVNRQRGQCETTIAGISAYSGSVTAKPATDLPPISITTDGAAATRALISKGRVSSIGYAACFWSSGARWFAMKARIFASVSGQTLRPPRISRTKCGSLAASRPNVTGAMSCSVRNASIVSGSGGSGVSIDQSCT